jgi:hypothetical protein
MNDGLPVDPAALRKEVKVKYRAGRRQPERHVFAEVMRVLRSSGRLQFADIANGKDVPAGALRNVDLWTD